MLCCPATLCAPSGGWARGTGYPSPFVGMPLVGQGRSSGRMALMRVGLTGGIASGKSTVSAMLAQLGATVIDADQLAREVVARGTPGLARVVAELGSEVLTPAGEMDRQAVGRIV